MSSLEILRKVSELGGELKIRDGRLALRSRQPLPDELRRAIKRERPAIMAALGAPPDVALRATLNDLRPRLPSALQALPDDHLLALVTYAVLFAWARRDRRKGT